MNKIFLTASLLAAAFAAPAQALVIGEADTGNGLPFGGNPGYYFQQIYSAAAFDSPITISRLSFYKTLFPNGEVNAGDFRLLLSTTSFSNIAQFDTTPFGANGSPGFLPEGAVEVYNSAAAPFDGDRLDFDLTTAFDYDPSAGNLLLTVFNLNLNSSVSTVFTDVDQNSPVMNIRFSSYPYDFNLGQVTGFNDGLAAVVPEPASWAMMIGGFGLIGAAMRRRSATVRFA